MDSLSTSVLRTKVPYEEATEIISPRLALNLKSTAPSGTGGNVNTGFASFNVPKGKDLLRNARPGLTSVNQKVCQRLHLQQTTHLYDRFRSNTRSNSVGDYIFQCFKCFSLYQCRILSFLLLRTVILFSVAILELKPLTLVEKGCMLFSFICR